MLILRFLRLTVPQKSLNCNGNCIFLLNWFQVREEVGVVTILINNAGIVSGAALLDTPDSKPILTDINRRMNCLLFNVRLLHFVDVVKPS